MVNEISRLMLRAYNDEAEVAVRAVKATNLSQLQTRLDKSRETIGRLGKSMAINITADYHQLRRQELHLVWQLRAAQAEEKDQARMLREQEREERKAQKEFEREKAKLLKEQAHYEAALRQLKASGTATAEELDAVRTKLAEVQDSIEGVDDRAANIRAGYVYVISNIGAFGPNMVKIGLTRRLEPMDRVRELGDASVGN